MRNRLMLAGLAVVLAAAPALAKLQIEKKPLKNIKKVAILTMAVDDIGKSNPMESNDKFLQDAVAYSLQVYNDNLKTLGKWELVPTPDVSAIEALVKDLPASPITQEVLNALADKDQLPGEVDKKVMQQLAMAAMFGKKKKVAEIKEKLLADTGRQMQARMDAIRANMRWEPSTAGLPYWMMNMEKPSNDINGAIYTVIDKAVKDYCAANGLDGVIFVHHLSEVGDHSKADVSIIVSDSRVLSTLKLNTAFVLRAADGKNAISNGDPRMDDLAPWKMGMPVYKGVRTDSKKMAGEGLIKDLKVDLNDPAGKAMNAYQGMIKSVSDKLMQEMEKKLK